MEKRAAGSVTRAVLVVAAVAAAAGCGKKGEAPKEVPAGGDRAPGAIPPRPSMEVPSAEKLAAKAQKSAEAAKRFSAWTPVHAFLAASAVDGAIVSAKEALAITRDNHVGTTTDGGASWSFVRHTSGLVYAAAGAPGGPYAVAGSGGYMAVSTDGRSWTELPRHLGEPLYAVAVGPLGVAAIGKNGGLVKMSPAGTDAIASALPNKFRATSVFVDAKQFIVTGGKGAAYVSPDGRAWTPVAITQPVANNMSSRGICGLGKVGKRRGVVCSVSGAAYGLSPTEAIVIGKSTVALTRDGGSTWAMAALPMKAIRGVAGRPGGPYHLYDPKGAFFSSADGGRTWTPGTDPAALQGAPAFPAKLAKCEGRLPAAAGDACQLQREVTSPADLPDVRGFKFLGDAGVAYGDDALVMTTENGGANWKVQSGLGLGRLAGFDARGPRVVAAGTFRVIASTDAGKSFRAVDLPPKTPPIDHVHIAADGTVYLSGRAGLILQSKDNLTGWTKLDTGPKNNSEYVLVHEVGAALYAAGARGELHRSGDAGKTWTPIALGVGELVAKMAGEGDTVIAVTQAGRWGGNKLLRSNDGGQHFVVQRELSEAGRVEELAMKSGVIRLGNLASADWGATWTRASDWYAGGSTVDIADGSGVRIANIGMYNGKDRFLVIGPEKDDITIVDSFYNKGARFNCDAASGCWMVAGGQVYRPDGRGARPDGL